MRCRLVLPVLYATVIQVLVVTAALVGSPSPTLELAQSPDEGPATSSFSLVSVLPPPPPPPPPLPTETPPDVLPAPRYAPSGGTSPPPSPTAITCSISIIGDTSAVFNEGSVVPPVAAATLAVTWGPERINITCTRHADSDPTIPSAAPIRIEVGGGLLPRIEAGGPNVTVSGNIIFTPSASDVSGFSLTFIDEHLARLELVDSALSRVPLSFDPLISCLACDYVRLSNVRLAHLYGDPEPLLTCDVYSYDVTTLTGRTVGPLYFRNARGISMEDLTCEDVRHANDFTCVMVEMLGFGLEEDDDPRVSLDMEYLRISRSRFLNNTVKPGNCLVYQGENQGFGAVVLHTAYQTDVALAEVVVSEVSVVGNVGGVGAGLAFSTDEATLAVGSVLIQQSTFTGNEARGHGGALFFGKLGSSSVQQIRITSGNIHDNSAGLEDDKGNGGFLYSDTAVESLTVDGASSIRHNAAGDSGGAFWLGRGLRRLSVLAGSSLSRNTAVTGDGGAIFIGSSSDLGPGTFIGVVDSVTIGGESRVDRNVAIAGSGGGLLIEAHVGRFTVSGGSGLWSNAAYGPCGGALSVGGTKFGQPNWVPFTVGTLLVSNGSSIRDNYAARLGGGVYIGGSIDGGDGIIVRDGSSVDGNWVYSSTSLAGGGIAVYGSVSSLAINNGSSMSYNEVNRDEGAGRSGIAPIGGGLWVSGRIGRVLVTHGSRLSWNKANRGGSAIAAVIINGSDTTMRQAGRAYTTDLVLVSGGSCVCDNEAGYAADMPSAYGALFFAVTRVVNFTVTDGSCLCRNKVPFGAGLGGAVHAEAGYGFFSICNHSNMSDNLGGNGGGLHVPALYVKDAAGKRPMGLETFELCAGSLMDGNRARTHGGAVYVDGHMGNVSITDSSVLNNSADISGGAFHLRGLFQRFLISDSQLINNGVGFDSGGFMHVQVLALDTADDAVPTAARYLPATGPYYMDVIRTNVSRNTAYKNGGAFSFQLYYYLPTVNDDSERLRLLKERYLYVRVHDSNFQKNWAHYGAGGAISFLTLMPIVQLAKDPRSASVSLGGFLHITNSSFTDNNAGDGRTRLTFVADVSSLNGNGGAVFVWATPYPVEATASPLLSKPSPPVEPDSCVQAEENMPPGIPAAFANASCWPAGSRNCALLLDGVNVTGNRATGGYGGGVNAAQCAIKVVRSRFSNNTSNVQGGGLAFMDYAAPWYVTLTNFSTSNTSSSQPPWPPPVGTWSSDTDRLLDYQPPDPASLPSNLSPLVFQNINNDRPPQQPWLVMYDTIVNHNSALYGGGAFLEVNKTSALVVNCLFSGNQAKVEGGGVLLVSNSTIGKLTAVLRDTNFTRNVAETYGGGLSLHSTRNKAATVLVGGTLWENSATHGGGIYSAGVKGTTLLMWDVSMVNNTGYNTGGGISYELSSYIPPPQPANNPLLNLPTHEAVVALLACRLHENHGLLRGGGGFITTTLNVRGVFRQTTITSNNAAYGAGIHLDASAGGELRVGNCTIAGNSAQLQGGGAYTSASCGGRLVIEEGSHVIDNSAGQCGGGAAVIRATGSSCNVMAASNSLNTTFGQQQGPAGDSNSSAVLESAVTGSSLNAVMSVAASMVLSNVTLAQNTAALQGGGAYAASDTVMAVNDSMLTKNMAKVSGGAIAAVNASLLHMSRCLIAENLAALSGGGIFAEWCVVIVENSSLILNTAAMGGGAHVAGFLQQGDADDNDNNSASMSKAGLRRRRLQPVADAADYGVAVSPAVAVLSNVNIYGNAAVTGLYPPNTAQQSAPTSAFLLSAQQFQPYEGHGGGMFFSGRIGAAISGCNTTLGNVAEVGTVLATTQACSDPNLFAHQFGGGENSSSSSSSSDPAGIQQLMDAAGGGRWFNTVAALSWAAKSNCSVLVIRETRLPGSTNMAAPTSAWAPSSTASSRTLNRPQQPLPLLWLQDLSASPLQASCTSLSSPDGGDSIPEEQAIARIVVQRVVAAAQHDVSNATAAATALSDPLMQQLLPLQPPAQADAASYASRLPLLQHMLQDCGEGSDELQQTDAPTMLAVPATHLRLMGIGGALLIPHVGVGGAQQYFSGTHGRFFSQSDILALVIAPNSAFSLEIQLFDGLGQPVVTDSPTFEVRLSIRPVDNNTSPYETALAVLRSVESNTTAVLTTSRGVAAWQDLELIGWPGKYILDVQAKATSGIAALPVVSNLAIHIDLLPCEVGQELLTPKDKDKGGPTPWTGCSTCRRDQAGLWVDRRTPLSRLLGDSLTHYGSSTWRDNMTREMSVLTGSIEGGKGCPSCCLSCPSHAACPGGALIVPTAGYWHSSPSSPIFHKCPQPSACGLAADGSRNTNAEGSFWDQALKLYFNMTDSYVVINTTATDDTTTNGGAPSLAANNSTAASGDLSLQLSSGDFILVSLRDDSRALLLGACQHWWYRTFPPNQNHLLASQYGITLQINMSTAPCYLYDQPQHTSSSSSSSMSTGNNRSYNQLQCATGYTGRLCATCVPGYSLTVDFGCMQCPPLARTVSVGLLAFWGTVALILFTTFSNLSKSRTEALQVEGLSSLDLLKTLITHVQYFIIITKLGIAYPAIITEFQSLLSALTGTENYIAYSPSCLFGGLDSAGQAAYQVALGLSAPCVATLVTLLLWALRYFLVNQSLLRRTKANRWNPDKDWPDAPSNDEEPGDGDAGDDLPPNLHTCSTATSCAITNTTSAGLLSNSSAGLTMQASSRMLGATASSLQQMQPSGSLLLDPVASVKPASSLSTMGSDTSAAAAALSRSAAALKAPLGTSPSLLLASSSIVSTPSSTRNKRNTRSVASSPAGNLPHVFIQLDDDSAPATAAAAAAGPTDIKTTAAAPRSKVIISLTAASGMMAPTTAAATPYQKTGTVAAVVAAVTPAALPLPPQVVGAPSPADKGGEPVLATALSKHALPPGAPNPFASARPTFSTTSGFQGHRQGGQRTLSSMDSAASSTFFDADADTPPPHPFVDDELAGGGGCGLWQALADMYANPGQWLMFADQAVPLLQQLEVVVIVASFILYPSLCQVALSIFACYKLDNGQGRFAENQQATWPEGYWVRNMQQECYTGVHKRLYVPVGVASVILFCLCPPVMYFLLTFLSRFQLDDPRIRIQYGFLYQQYKPKYFWWASMRQLQVLALVAVEVFGRALPVLQQALLLLAVLILIAAVNTATSPERFGELIVLEFLSMCVLSMTLTLGLYFVADDAGSRLDTTSANIVGSLILVINAVFIAAVLFSMAKHSARAAGKVRHVMSSTWRRVVTSLSHTLSKIEERASERSGGGGVLSGVSAVMYSGGGAHLLKQQKEQQQEEGGVLSTASSAKKSRRAAEGVGAQHGR